MGFIFYERFSHVNCDIISSSGNEAKDEYSKHNSNISNGGVKFDLLGRNDYIEGADITICKTKKVINDMVFY